MSRQYKRAYELKITNSGTVRTIRDLRISFDITKSLISTPNLANIKLYNPNNDTVALLNGDDVNIQLSVGYGDNIRLVFKGDIVNFFQRRESVDRIVDMYARDGHKDWTNSTFNKTLSENISVKDSISEIISTFTDTAIGLINGLPEATDKLRGQTLSGASKDLLDMYASEYDFQWSIQDGEIIITPDDDTIATNEAVLITALTGMVGSPAITKIGADVSSLLNPLLQPNTPFKIESISSDVTLADTFFREIESTSAEGFYRIQEVNHVGDNYGESWLSTCKGITLNV